MVKGKTLSYRNTAAFIDRSALVANLERLKLLAANNFFCPMVKANAYGHSALMVTQILVDNQVKNVGVATLEEAIELRKKFKDLNILMFGAFDKKGVDVFYDDHITPVVNSIEQLELLMDQQKKLDIHLKFNTGMNRMGLDLKDLDAAKKILANSKYLELKGLSTHFGVSPNHSAYQLQLERFDQIVDALGTKGLHIYSSTKTISQAPMTMGFRPGIALYGGLSQELSFRPVMTLKSELVRVRHIQPHDYVSYGANFVAKKPSVVGVVSLGYADGYRRGLSNKGRMLINGNFAPVAGTVCMDYTMLDLTDAAPKAQVGDEVVVIGTQDQKQILAIELADVANTISYEIFTGISSRVPRILIHD